MIFAVLLDDLAHFSIMTKTSDNAFEGTRPRVEMAQISGGLSCGQLQMRAYGCNIPNFCDKMSPSEFPHESRSQKSDFRDRHLQQNHAASDMPSAFRSTSVQIWPKGSKIEATRRPITSIWISSRITAPAVTARCIKPSILPTVSWKIVLTAPGSFGKNSPP